MPLQLPEAVFFDVDRTLIDTRYQPIQGAKSFINKLQRDGVKVGLVSNAKREEVIAATQALELNTDDLIILTVEDVGPDFIKPFPHLLNKACKRAGVDPSETWYIGDHAMDMLCAWFANCSSIILDNKAASAIITPQEVWSGLGQSEAGSIRRHLRDVFGWTEDAIDQRLARKTAENLTGFSALSTIYDRLISTLRDSGMAQEPK